MEVPATTWKEAVDKMNRIKFDKFGSKPSVPKSSQFLRDKARQTAAFDVVTQFIAPIPTIVFASIMVYSLLYLPTDTAPFAEYKHLVRQAKLTTDVCIGGGKYGSDKNVDLPSLMLSPMLNKSVEHIGSALIGLPTTECYASSATSGFDFALPPPPSRSGRVFYIVPCISSYFYVIVGSWVAAKFILLCAEPDDEDVKLTKQKTE